jgi:predicted nucleotidyltransferase
MIDPVWTVFYKKSFNAMQGGNPMYDHHRDSIRNITEKLRADENIQALIIAGSIAHGFAGEDSDVDIMIVVSQQEYEERCRTNRALYYERESCTYEKGYIDGKYISTDYIREVIRYGGEPARFAFTNCWTAFSRIEGLDDLIREAARYPSRYREVRMRRFYAHMNEWYWFYNEGLSKNNPYLVNTALCNTVLYGGRAILAYNELLFPYHKWFLKVLEKAREKPSNVMELIDRIFGKRLPEDTAEFVSAVRNFTDWGVSETEWPSYLMLDVDLGCYESVL